MFIGTLMLKLKFQHFGHLMQRSDSFEKTLMLEKTEGKRRRLQQRMRYLDSITNSMDMNLRKFQDRRAWCVWCEGSTAEPRVCVWFGGVHSRAPCVGCEGSTAEPRVWCEDSQESSPAPQFKSIYSLALSFLHSPTLTSMHDHRKNHSLD